jgi:ATP-binding cassette, subfamily B, bacterial PglK
LTSIFKYIREVLYLLGESRRKLPLLILFFLILSILNIVGLGLIAPYITLVINPDLIIQGNFQSIFETFGLPLDQKPLLIILGVGLMGVFLLKTITAILVNRAIITYSLEQRIRLCSYLMKAFQNMPYTVHMTKNTSEYIHSIQSLTSVFTGVIQMGLKVMSEAVVAIFIVILLAWTDILALGILVLFLGGVLLGYDRLFRDKMKDCGKYINEATIKIVKAVSEAMDGFKEIQILGKEHFFQKSVNDGIKVVVSNSVKTGVISTAPHYMMEFILITFVVTLVVGGLLLNQDIQLLIPTLGMFGIAALRLLPSVNAVSQSILKLRIDRHSVTLLHEDLIKLEDINSKLIRIISDQHIYQNFQYLSVENIYFRYPNTNEWAIENLTISINSGESIGLIGPSGSGKTTLVDIILGLLEPQKGKLLYNGNALKNSKLQWRSNLAYLPQDIFIIDDTLRRNVVLGDEDTEINEDKLYKALSQARLAELVEELPDGVNTKMGEKGVRLSGGQRQRVALARAFYHERSVLVLDEATSSLDNETELEIVEEIKQLKSKITLIVIAHRLSTVKFCDQIYRLEKGQIVDVGPPQKMLNLIVENNV